MWLKTPLPGPTRSAVESKPASRFHWPDYLKYTSKTPVAKAPARESNHGHLLSHPTPIAPSHIRQHPKRPRKTSGADGYATAVPRLGQNKLQVSLSGRWFLQGDALLACEMLHPRFKFGVLRGPRFTAQSCQQRALSFCANFSLPLSHLPLPFFPSFPPLFRRPEHHVDTSFCRYGHHCVQHRTAPRSTRSAAWFRLFQPSHWPDRYTSSAVTANIPKGTNRA